MVEGHIISPTTEMSLASLCNALGSNCTYQKPPPLWHCKKNGWNVFSSTFFSAVFCRFIKNNCFHLSCQFCWDPINGAMAKWGQGQCRDNSQLYWERKYSISMSCLHYFSVGVCHLAGFISTTKSRELSICPSPDRDCFWPWEGTSQAQEYQPSILQSHNNHCSCI